MKVSEFEAKLGTVSDSKLLQMLAISRERGPDVAVSMILAEARKRGLEDGEIPTPPGRYPERMEAAGEELSGMAAATSSYPREGAGAYGADAPVDGASGVRLSGARPDGTGALSDSAAPALAPEWLTEETKSGMPMALKALLLIGFVGGLLALAWKFTR
jgi:hypothetical protein